MNIGEEITAAYLRVIKKCDFIQLNFQTPDVQGEIDVMGINLAEKKLYVCEVAIHLTSGLRYVRDKRPNTVIKFIEKFTRDIEYARQYFPDYAQHYMLWSPVVKTAKEDAKENQVAFVAQVQDKIQATFGLRIEAVINRQFQDKLSELRKYAAAQTEELKSPVLRYLQVEEYLSSHLRRMEAAERRRVGLEQAQAIPVPP